MHAGASIAGFALIFAILLDAFETVVLPRRIQRRFRISAWYYRVTWMRWTRLAQRIKSPSRREGVLAYFGPFSLIQLMGYWAIGLIFGFACVQYGLGEHLQLGNEKITFGKLLYHSGETFFTLGYGDIVPVERWRLLGPITAMNGALLFGWSTAVMFEVLRKSWHRVGGSQAD